MSGDVVNYRDTTTSLNKRKIANQVLKRPANYTSCVNAAPACWAPAQYHWQLSVILYRLASIRINTFPSERIFKENGFWLSLAQIELKTSSL